MFRRLMVKSAPALLFCLLPLANVSAQELEDAEDIESFEMSQLLDFSVPLVQSVSKREERATDAPATVLVISREDIRLRGYAFLTDVLRDLPGMETAEYYFSEMGTLVPVRGTAGNNKIIVLVNGVRVNPPGGESMMFRNDISVRSAEKIEIIYGPGSTLYGQDAISAVINIQTQQVKDELFVEFGAASGYPAKGEAWASFGLPLEDGSITASVHFLYSQLMDLSSEFETEWNTNYRPVIDERGGVGAEPERWDEGLNALLRIEVGDSSIQLWHRQSSRSSSDGFNGNFAKVEEAIWADMSTLVEGRNRLQILDELALESSLVFNRYEIDPDTRYVWANSPPASWFMDDYKYGLGISASLEEKAFITLTKDFDLLVGLVAAHYDIMPKATVPGGADRSIDIASQGGAFTYYETPGDPSSLRSVARINNINYQTLGGFVEAAFRVIDPVKLIAGVRVDADTRFNLVPISPRVAAIWEIIEALTVKAIYTRAWVNPAPYFAYNTYFNGRAINTVNPELQPEQANTGEIELTLTLDKLLVGLSAYLSFQDKLLVQGDRELDVNVVNPEVYLDLAGNQPVMLTQSANAGETRAMGFDLHGKYTVGPVAMWASYSFVDFQSETEDVEQSGLQGLSAHNVRLGVTWAILSELFVTLSGSLRSTPQNIPTSRMGTLENELELPYELNAHVLWSPIQGLDVFANVRNLTHNHYALDGIFGPYPQETLRVSAGASYRF